MPRTDAFAWPSRSRSLESARAADRVAAEAILKVRSRSARARGPETAPDPASESPPSSASRPVPWDRELDRLTEDLVDELRRDLGPSA